MKQEKTRYNRKNNKKMCDVTRCSPKGDTTQMKRNKKREKLCTAVLYPEPITTRTSNLG